MGILLKLLGMVLPGGLDSLLTAVLGHFEKKADRELEGFKTGVQVDLEAYRAHLRAAVEINQMKLASNGWWGAKLIILIAGLPCALHLALVMIDSTFMLGCGRYGCLGIPKVPAPYDSYEWAIVQSFFLVMPAMPLVSAASAWMRRK